MTKIITERAYPAQFYYNDGGGPKKLLKALESRGIVITPLFNFNKKYERFYFLQPHNVILKHTQDKYQTKGGEKSKLLILGLRKNERDIVKIIREEENKYFAQDMGDIGNL